MKFLRNPSVKKKRQFKRSGTFHVYMVECLDGTYYTGCTNDLKRRLKEHTGDRQGGAKYTRWKGAGKVVWKKEYRYYKCAVNEERRIKRLARYQKEELVYGRKAK